MVFANLSHGEKDAFFSLLDEYFESRPQLASKLRSSGESGALQSAVSRAASAFGGSSSTSPPPPGNPNRRSGPAGSAALNTAKGLVSRQGFSDVDTSSKGAMLASAWKKNQPPPPPQQPPSAFGAKKNSFSPPPSRSAPPPAADPEPEAAQGEWAEALYDYDSTDPQDLQIREKQQVWVTERTSADWWTGQINGEGKSGLFPASYVKVL